MREIQNIFNNREIAIGIWVMLVAIISIFTKPVKKFLKSVFPILFCRKFVVFYIVFLLHLCLVTYFLYAVGFWSVALLKDTIFWVLCVELPLFVKTIEKAKDNHFFVKLIKDNITISVIIEFVFNFWTFNLFTEILIVPISIFIGLLYALAAREKKYFQVKRFFDWLFVIFGVIIIINSCKHLYENPSELFNLSTLQEFLLPAFLLLLNLPVVYGLSKITAIRNNLQYITVISLTDNDMKENLKKLKNKLSMRVGDNYMKRANYYILWCIIGFLISVLGIVICNSQVSIRDFLKFNFTVDIQRVKEIITYICSTGVVFSICLFIYSLGFRKKKNEEISQVKKFALHNLLFSNNKIDNIGKKISADFRAARIRDPINLIDDFDINVMQQILSNLYLSNITENNFYSKNMITGIELVKFIVRFPVGNRAGKKQHDNPSRVALIRQY